MTMIERVARAMFHAECEPHKAVTGYGETFGWDDAMPAVRERLLASAAAAIQIMRAPSQAMRLAGLTAWATACGAMPENSQGKDEAEVGRQRLMHIGAVSVSTIQLVPAWEAMIDAALEEGN